MIAIHANNKPFEFPRGCGYNPSIVDYYYVDFKLHSGVNSVKIHTSFQKNVEFDALFASGVMHTTYDAAQEHAQTLRRLYQEMVAF